METKKILGIILGIFFLASIFVGLPLLKGLAFGIVLAYISRPIAYSAKDILGKTWSSALTLLAIVLILLSLGVYAGSTMVDEAQKINQLENQQLEETITSAQNFLDANPEVKEFLENTYNSVISSIAGTSSELANKIYSSIIATLDLVTTAFLSFVFAFYFLKDGANIRSTLVDLSPEKHKHSMKDLVENIDSRIEGMFVGSLYTSGFTAILTGIVLFIFNIPYAVFIALFSGILQFLPLVASQTILVPLGIILILFKNYLAGAGILALALFLFFTIDSLIRPWLTSSISRTHPVVILVAFIGGALAFGPVGFILGPIILSCLEGGVETYAAA